MSDLYPIKRALISVSDKTDVIKLAEALFKCGVEIISTGGSAAALPPVDIISTPHLNKASASLITSVLSDTEIKARLIG